MVEIPHLDKRVWILLIAAGAGLGLYLRHRSASSGASPDTSTDSSIGTVDGSADPYSSGDVTAIPGTQYGMAGPPGPPGARGKRGPRGRPPKHKHHKHHRSGTAPRIAQQSHMASSTPVQSGVRVVQHRPGGVVSKGVR